VLHDVRDAINEKKEEFTAAVAAGKEAMNEVRDHSSSHA